MTFNFIKSKRVGPFLSAITYFSHDIVSDDNIHSKAISSMIYAHHDPLLNNKHFYMASHRTAQKEFNGIGNILKHFDAKTELGFKIRTMLIDDKNPGLENYFVTLRNFQEGVADGHSLNKYIGFDMEHFVVKGLAYTIGFLDSFSPLTDMFFDNPFQTSYYVAKNYLKELDADFVPFNN